MKQLFKKNQIIITALALMICAAGYLQFSNPGEDTDTGKQGLYAAGTSDASKGDAVETGNTGAQITVTVGSTNKTAENSGNAQTADTGNTEEDTHRIGDAVMVSTTLHSNFTTNARLVREQRRAQSKETLMGIIDNASLSDEQKQIAVETLVSLTNIAEKENAAELLLEAKGFADPIVNIVDNEVDVVINAVSVTSQQIAQIEDIVMRKTGFEPKDITITAAVQED